MVNVSHISPGWPAILHCHVALLEPTVRGGKFKQMGGVFCLWAPPLWLLLQRNQNESTHLCMYIYIYYVCVLSCPYPRKQGK